MPLVAVPAPPKPQPGALSAAPQVGRVLFFDKALSASGAMSCATCHDPDHAYGPPNELAVQLGGTDGGAEGTRAVPSLRYKEYTPPYADLLDNPDGVSAPGPGGGFAWDGRASTLAEQADCRCCRPSRWRTRVRPTSFASCGGAVRGRLRAAFPRPLARHGAAVFKDVLTALQAFQLEDRSFHPYTSKFDLHADNKIGGTFTAAETRGFKVFVDAKTGNCASCHYHGRRPGRQRRACSPTSRTRRSACRATPRSRPTRTRGASILGLVRAAARTISGPRPEREPTRSAACSRRRRCATSPRGRRSSTTASCTRSSRPCASTRRATRGPSSGTRRSAGARRRATTRRFPTYGLVTTQYVGRNGAEVRRSPRAAPRRTSTARCRSTVARAARGLPLGERDVQDLICFLETLTDGYDPPATPPTTGRCVE